MKIFFDGIPAMEFKNRKKIKGMWLTWLHGLNISIGTNGKYDILPIYVSQVKFINISKNQKYWEFRCRKGWRAVHLMFGWPFIHTEFISFENGLVENIE